MSGIIIKVINGESYEVFPIVSFVSESEGELVDIINFRLRKRNLTPRWEGDYLKEVAELHGVARELFRGDKIGILYFINDSEPDVPIRNYRVKKGDSVEVIYIGEWER